MGYTWRNGTCCPTQPLTLSFVHFVTTTAISMCISMAICGHCKWAACLKMSQLVVSKQSLAKMPTFHLLSRGRWHDGKIPVYTESVQLVSSPVPPQSVSLLSSPFVTSGCWRLRSSSRWSFSSSFLVWGKRNQPFPSKKVGRQSARQKKKKMNPMCIYRTGI